MQHRRAQRTIGVLAPWMGGDFLGNILVAIHEMARRNDLRVVVTCTSIQTTTQRTLSFLNLLSSPPGGDQIDGWVLVGDALKPEDLRELTASGKPAIVVSGSTDNQQQPLIISDNYGGMLAGVRHLLEHGHKRVAFVGSMHMGDMQERYRGYVDAHAEHGLELDPALLIDVERPWPEYGRQVARAMIEQGITCTAIVCGNDELAFGVLPTLVAAGYRVPEDLALLGFDDREEAQYQDPPLSSIRQNAYGLGVRAMELLLSCLTGETPGFGPHHVATALVQRRSCGCDDQDAAVAAAYPLHHETRTWQEALTQRLLTMALYPMQPNPAVMPADYWTGVDRLVHALEQALTNQQLPAPHELAYVWEHALRLTTNLKVLHSLIALLEQAGLELLARQKHGPTARGSLSLFIERLRYDLAQTLLSEESRKAQFYAQELRNSDMINGTLLQSAWFQRRDLDWLHWTDVRWGCLGIWENNTAQQTPEIKLLSAYTLHNAPTPTAGTVYPWGAYEPSEILAEQGAAEEADITIMVPFQTTEDGGVLTLVETVNQKFLQRYDAIYHWVYSVAVAVDRETLLSKLNHQQEELQLSNDALKVAKERAEQASAFKSQFLANMSHELRTPLNAIINFTEFTMDPDYGEISDQQRYFQTRVMYNAEHLLGLINDVLDLSKIEAGKMELAQSRSDLHPLLSGVMSTAIGLTKTKGLSLELEAPEQLPPVWIDKTRVRQVLLNLLSNAAKFTAEGGITVLVRQVEQGLLTISVRDTGMGIPPGDQGRVFEEFQQVQGAQSSEIRGTGLGLPISKRLIEMHGGRMWLESIPGKGSTFSFTIPLAAEEQGELAEQPAGLTQLAERREGTLITIVDDDPDSRQILRTMLERHGYEVAEVTQSEQALAQLRLQQPDLVLLDLNMEPLSGWDVLEQLQSDPGLSSLPVIICSVQNLDEDEIQVLPNLCLYLQKPVRQDDLLALIRQLTPPSSVLIVDDDPDARQVLRGLLQDMDIDVFEATNGAEALAQIEIQRPELILLDLMMPVLDGFGVLAYLQQQPELAELPVIAITAKDLSLAEQQWLSERTRSCIQKPVSSSQFLARIRRLVPETRA